MSKQQRAFAEAIAVLERLGIPYLIGGALASMAYGEPRLTADMDLVVDMTVEQARALARAFGPDWYADEQSIMGAVRQRGHFNLIHAASGIKVDCFLLGDSARDRAQFARRRRRSFDPQREAYFAAPEDVILKKLEYYRLGGSSKHLEDIRGILRVSGELLDLDLLQREAQALGVADLWRQLLKESKPG